MPDIQMGSHTLRSHGTKVLRFHMQDWIILILLAVIDGCLNIIEPFHRFVGRDMMTDLRYPMKKNTVPFWAVPVHSILSSIQSSKERFFIINNTLIHCGIVRSSSWQILGIVLPFFIILGIYFKRKNVLDLHNAVLGRFLFLYVYTIGTFHLALPLRAELIETHNQACFFRHL